MMNGLELPSREQALSNNSPHTAGVVWRELFDDESQVHEFMEIQVRFVF